MKTALSLLLGLAVVFALALTATAEDKEKGAEGGKQVTLKGTITCAKCDLKETDKCYTVIKARKSEGDKEEVYWFDPDSHKKHHRKICTEPHKGTVKGTISEKDGKKQVKVSDVKFEE